MYTPQLLTYVGRRCLLQRQPPSAAGQPQVIVRHHDEQRQETRVPQFGCFRKNVWYDKEYECVYLCVCVWEREIVYVCVCARACVCVCVYCSSPFKDRGRECRNVGALGKMFGMKRNTSVYMCACVCVCVWMCIIRHDGCIVRHDDEQRLRTRVLQLGCFRAYDWYKTV